MPKLLEGIRVLECSGWVHGTASGYMLGDLGAEVVKVEEPVRGDPARGAETLYGVAMSLPGGRNMMFEHANRNKKSITLNLSSSKGREVLYRLVGRADVFLTNYRQGIRDKLGIDYGTLAMINPKLIYALASGYGTRGPLADGRAFDPIAQACSGAMWAVGDRDHAEPWQIVGGLFDQLGATLTAYGILAGLLGRERLGIGQVVETSLLAAAIHVQGSNVNALTLRGVPMARHSRCRARNPMANHYPCADGKWLMLAEPQSDRFWSEFCAAIDVPELATKERFATAVKRREYYREVLTVLEKTFLTKTRDEWLSVFKDRGCQFAYAPILGLQEAVASAQVVENEYVTEFDDPALGRVKEVGFPVQFSETPAEVVSAAPEFGQHTEQVLLDLGGYSWTEIEELRASGVI